MKERIPWALVFLVMKIKKYPIYASKNCLEDKHVDLLLIGERRKKHCVLIKDFNSFMYDYTLHRGREHFCRYCLQALRTAILNVILKTALKLIVNKELR